MPELMTVKDAMAYLKVSRVTLYALMRRGQLRWVELPGVRGRRFRREDLDRLQEIGTSWGDEEGKGKEVDREH